MRQAGRARDAHVRPCRAPVVCEARRMCAVTRARLRRPAACVRACGSNEPGNWDVTGDVTGLSVLTELKYMCVCVVQHPPPFGVCAERAEDPAFAEASCLWRDR
eukprot:COSAG01_NODE_957_length_12474_cov_44.298182_8_plen_104_part_00